MLSYFCAALVVYYLSSVTEAQRAYSIAGTLKLREMQLIFYVKNVSSSTVFAAATSRCQSAGLGDAISYCVQTMSQNCQQAGGACFSDGSTGTMGICCRRQQQGNGFGGFGGSSNDNDQQCRNMGYSGKRRPVVV